MFQKFLDRPFEVTINNNYVASNPTTNCGKFEKRTKLLSFTTQGYYSSNNNLHRHYKVGSLSGPWSNYIRNRFRLIEAGSNIFNSVSSTLCSSPFYKSVRKSFDGICASPGICAFNDATKLTADDSKKRIMILMSDTGGGHRASAEALKQGFQIMYGNKFQVECVDIWSDWTPYPFNQLPKTYSFLVRNPVLWWLGYNLQQPRIVHYPTSAFSSVFVSRTISHAYDLYRPDLVVSVHPLMQHVPLQVLKKKMRFGVQHHAKFATVVTDLTTCHNLWFHPDVDRCYTPTEKARLRALKMGLKPIQVKVLGLPIRPTFSNPFLNKKGLRKVLGMDLDKPSIILVGGGEGMGAIEEIVDALVAKIGAKCQLVVICGRNNGLAKILRSRSFPMGMVVQVLDYVCNMEEWMIASDAIVTKAGPGTLAESLACGLPLMLNGYIPCQESGNVPFVLENKVGAYETNPERIAEKIAGWFSYNHVEFLEMAARAREIGSIYKTALFSIVEDLAAMISEGTK